MKTGSNGNRAWVSIGMEFEVASNPEKGKGGDPE